MDERYRALASTSHQQDYAEHDGWRYLVKNQELF